MFRYPPVYRKHLSEETQDKIKGSQGHKSDGSKKSKYEAYDTSKLFFIMRYFLLIITPLNGLKSY